MPLLETHALVLGARDYRETSLLVTLLTPERGCVGAVAKGARRPKSTLAAVLQPFSLLAVRLYVRPAGGLATLGSADLVERPDFSGGAGGALGRGGPAVGAVGGAPSVGGPKRAEEGLARLAYAGFFAEVLASTQENDPHSPELFDLAREFFHGLAAAPHPGSFALQGFFALLAALGYAPQLDAVGPRDASSAQKAGETPAPQQARQPPGRAPFLLNLVEGTLRPTPSLLGPNDFPLSRAAVDALGRLTAAPPDAPFDEPILVPKAVGPTLARLAVRLFETHLERSFRSARFLEEMVLKEQ